MELESLDVNKLKELRELVSKYDSIDSLVSRIDSVIVEREEISKSSLNVRFNMDMFIRLQIFDPSEFKVIRANNINNMQELIDCDLDSLVGITPSIKEGLLWVRGAYDLSSYDDNSGTHKLK